jgi:hypothetical protein
MIASSACSCRTRPSTGASPRLPGGMRRPQPGGPPQAGHETVPAGGRPRDPLDRVLAPANRHDSPLLASTLDKLDDLGPLPDDITVHLDTGYDSQKTRDELNGRGMTGEIARKGNKAPSRQVNAGTSSDPSAWHNAFNRPAALLRTQRGVIDAFFGLADVIITVRSLIRQAWILYRWDDRPARRP